MSKMVPRDMAFFLFLAGKRYGAALLPKPIRGAERPSMHEPRGADDDPRFLVEICSRHFHGGNYGSQSQERQSAHCLKWSRKLPTRDRRVVDRNVALPPTPFAPCRRWTPGAAGAMLAASPK